MADSGRNPLDSANFDELSDSPSVEAEVSSDPPPPAAPAGGSRLRRAAGSDGASPLRREARFAAVPRLGFLLGLAAMGGAGAGFGAGAATAGFAAAAAEGFCWAAEGFWPAGASVATAPKWSEGYAGSTRLWRSVIVRRWPVVMKCSVWMP